MAALLQYTSLVFDQQPYTAQQRFIGPSCSFGANAYTQHGHTKAAWFRLWHAVLKMHDPIWAASGVPPVASRACSKSWKALVMTSVKLQSVGIGGDVLLSPQAVCQRGLCLWNSGLSALPVSLGECSMSHKQFLQHCTCDK